MREKTVSKGKYYSEQFGTLRTIYNYDEKKALFCAKDVAKALGFGNPSTSVRDICLNCVKEAHMTDGGLQVMNFIGWDDIERLYRHSRNKEMYPYIEYLCNLETSMYDKAKQEIANYESNGELDVKKAVDKVLEMLNRYSETYRKNSSKIAREFYTNNGQSADWMDAIDDVADNFIELSKYLSETYGATIDIKNVTVTMKDGQSYDFLTEEDDV